MFDIFKKLEGLRPAAPTGPVEAIVAGLGNPGREYENTRHNAGFLVLDQIAGSCGVRLDRLKYKSLCADAVLGGRRVLLMKPQTFMNLSGQAVTEAMRFYKLPAEKVIVIFDDISLEPGKLRIRRKGSDGGHNGIKNIIYLSGKDTFPRIKMGVGKKPRPDYDLAAWVLGSFPKELTETLDDVFERAATAAMMIVEGNIEKAMKQFNS